MRINLEKAAKLLKSGSIIAVPTETVYGLAAALNQTEAIQEIFSLKKRPPQNPLIIHVSEKEDIYTYIKEKPTQFDELAEMFWPGPLTLILPIEPSLIPPMARAHLPTAGFRIPKHPLAKELLKQTGPLVMPSANLSGKPSATTASHVEEDFGLDFPVLDGGKCENGLESTILAYLDGKWVILRMGAIAAEEFKNILGYLPQVKRKENGEKPICPGQLFRHYAPKAKLFLGNQAKQSEAGFILGFKERTYSKEKRVIILGSLFNAKEVAENLYDALRQLDLEQAQTAWIDTDFPQEGLWMTISERLQRASEG